MVMQYLLLNIKIMVYIAVFYYIEPVLESFKILIFLVASTLKMYPALYIYIYIYVCMYVLFFSYLHKVK